MEEELSVGDTEELAIEEDIALPDIDTLETSETEEGAEEISDTKEEPAQEETEVEPETAPETDLEISEPPNQLNKNLLWKKNYLSVILKSCQ